MRIGGSRFSRLERALRRKERRRFDIRPRALSCHASTGSVDEGTGFFVLSALGGVASSGRQTKGGNCSRLAMVISLMVPVVSKRPIEVTSLPRLNVLPPHFEGGIPSSPARGVPSEADMDDSPAAPLPVGSLSAKVVTDEVGRKVELPDSPQRIISLAPSITETLFALGLERQDCRSH